MWRAISIVLAIVVLWIAIFGVTCNGTHYWLSCSEERGTEIKKERVREDEERDRERKREETERREREETEDSEFKKGPVPEENESIEI